jgi:molecular chaperone GrpE
VKAEERCENEEAAAATADAGQADGQVPAGAGEGPGEQDPVAALEADLGKWRELALRTAADLENYRKRMARDKQEAVRYANQSLLEELLPVLDNFEMGMEAAAAEKGSMIFIGMDMVRRQFADMLGSHGVTPVAVAAGDEFDPAIQEAVIQEASDTVAAGRVVRVMRRGFRMHDRLLRPATVVVSSGPAAAPTEG